MFNSVKLEVPCEPINLTPMNPLISKCQIKVCWVGEQPNRNKSIITKEVATQMANSLPGSPIVGYYNRETDDFESHNKEIEIKDGKFFLSDATKPYGFVDLGAKCWFQKFLDNGIEHEYLMTEGYLWTGQYPECKRVIEKGNNQSMELDEILTDGSWAKSNNGKQEFFIINETIISKLCILGEDVEPCFEGASISKMQFSFDDDFNQRMYSMMKEVTEYFNKGGEQMDAEIITENEVTEEEVVTAEVEEPVVEPVEEAEPQVEEAETPVEETAELEPEEPEPAAPQYNLDEIPEYVELQQNYAALEQQIADLNNTIDSLNNQLAPLVEFKKQVDKEKKEALINSFYMLSDEEKKDVVNNIDSYSLDEIEAKLSIICVRNKVSFNLDDDTNKNETVTTFNLEDSAASDLTPAWVKAVLDTEKNLKK